MPTAGMMFAVVLAALTLLDFRAEGIVCYDCNSAFDPRCGDNFDPYSLGMVDCDMKQALDHLSGANATLCRKLVQKVGLKTRVVRGCGYLEDAGRDGGCVSRSGTHDVSVLYCSCKGNLCNAATPRALPGPAGLGLALSAATAVLLAARRPLSAL